MARKVIVELVDDLDNTSTAAETVTFGVDGAHYEIDLSDANAATLRDEISQWTAHARRIGRTPKTVTRLATAAGTSHKRADLTAIRAWAADNGYNVSARGRIAAEVVAAYDTATA